jgi:hypothetical protein
MAGSNKGSKGSGRSAGGKVVKANQAQRNRKLWMDQNRGEMRIELRRDANAFRTRLPKAMREGLGVNTVGGALERMVGRSRYLGASRQGMSRAEEDKFIRVLDASGRGGRGGFSGVRIRVDNAGRRNIEATPMAQRQMSFAEKAGSRRRR